MALTWLHRLGSPERCYKLCSILSPIFLSVFLLCFGVALVWGLFISPADYQQGDAFRIIYLHVPAAVMSVMVYVVMSVAYISYFIWRIPVADWFATIAAPIGALMTVLTLVTGSLWGKPTWGTFWIWDARLTSELILFFIYLGIMAVRQLIPHAASAARASGLVACVGLVNLPIIHYSVVWWHTLHQGATILQLAKPSIASSMLGPLLVMFFAYVGFVGYLIVTHLARLILANKAASRWVRERFASGSGASND